MFHKRIVTADHPFMIVLAVGALSLIAVLAALASGGWQPIEAPAVGAPSSVTTIDRAQQAEAARLRGLAGETVNLYGSTSWVKASGLSAAQRAEAARLSGLAEQYVNLHGSSAWVRAIHLNQAQRTEAARLTGLAEEYVNLHGSTAWVRAFPLDRAQRTEAARWTGQAIAVGVPPDEVSASVAVLLGP